MQTLRNQFGQASLIMVLVIVAITFIVVASVGLLTYNDIRNVEVVVASSQSYYTAEAGIEDAVFRLTSNMKYQSSYNLDVGGNNTAVAISGPLTALTITSSGVVNNSTRKLQVALGASQSTSQIAFNYGVQVGYGGLIMGNNAGINGNVYANGVISGGNGAFITGSAFSANAPDTSADQDNSAPTTPANSINFGDTNANQDLAQSFQVSANLPVNKVQLYLKKTSTPGNLTVRIVTDASGVPSATTLASGSLLASAVGTTYAWLDVSMTSNPQLNAGTTYWLVVDGSTSSGKYYTAGANSSYTNGQAKLGPYSAGPWSNTSPTGLDAYFKIFLGGTSGSISNVNVGTVATGDTRAHTVTGSTIAGNNYCQVGSGNNKACNTTQADPSSADFPLSDANVETYKAEAQAGGTLNGDYNLIVNGSTASLGPKVITGNMNIANSSILTLTGTIWVQGNLTLDNGVLVKLASIYGSSGGTIVVGGYVNISNNSSFAGSGQTGSYMLVISTNDCNGTTSPTGLACIGSNSAISVGNNAGLVALVAPICQVEVANGASAREITGYRLNLSPNATINYDTGLANANFSSGPGGGFQISSWKEIE